MHRDDETTRAMAYSCRPSHAASFLIALLALPLLAAASSAAPAPAPAIKIKSMDHRGLSVMPLPSPVSGPESLAFDRRGGGPYAGVSDGRVLRWRGRRLGWTVFAYNSRHKSVGMCAAKKKLVVPESVCGRPLGLQFHHMTGDLYVADAYLGLLRVPARGGMAEVVATEAGGVPFNFLNGLDVDQKTGHVYFTDSSTFYRRSQYLLVVALGDETGRLLRYDPRTRRVAVLHDSLSYPNGVAVAADGSSVVVSHTALCELRRYWVRGARVGENETFAELPGYPDNVRSDGLGGYWVALSHGADDAGVDAVPTLAVRVGPGDGAVEEALEGLSFATVSEVAERNGTLWVGSVDTPYAAELGPR
uniref:Uncharacterized protein n=1 Tax=Avena sativa TaxID=4498 RepID=A0ACD5Y9X6_AVESA